MKLGIGEIVTLDDNKEFICLKRTNLNGKDYIYLISNFKPIEIRFAEEIIENDEVYVLIVGEPELKKQLLEKFESNN